jgi:ABC-type transport system involved in multi-copper enzyme maturation permease subunit
MSAAVAAQMISADLLKIRKRRSTVVWSLVLALAPLLIYFIVGAAQHSSSPSGNPPAGGVAGFQDALRIVAVLFGPLAAILIGTDAGAGDASAGVFRDLVVTGRSRLALFATRVLAAIAMTWVVSVLAYGVLAIGIYALADGSQTPTAATMLNGFGFTLLSMAVVCAVAVGFSSLTASKPGALVALIGWQLVASPILVGIDSLGSVRELVLRAGINRLAPVELGGPGSPVSISTGTALVVIVGWLVVFGALGAWRTRTIDA